MSRRPEPQTLAEASDLLGVSIPTTARLLGISEAAAYASFARGELPGRRIAGRCLVSAPALLAMFDAVSHANNVVADATSSLDSKGAHKCKSRRRESK